MGSRAAWERLKSWWGRRSRIRAASGNPYRGSGAANATSNSFPDGNVPASSGAGSGSPRKHRDSSIDPAKLTLQWIAEHAEQKPREVDETIRDIVELEYFNGLQKQRQLQSRIEKQQATGMAALMEHHLNGTNPSMPSATTPTTAANTSTALEDDQAIHNRCNWINHNYYQDAPREEIREDIDKRPQPPPQPSPAPQSSGVPGWVWIVVLLAIMTLMALAALWYALTHPSPVVTPPGPPVVIPAENAYTTIKLGDAP
jgi:hypothetical protein